MRNSGQSFSFGAELLESNVSTAADPSSQFLDPFFPVPEPPEIRLIFRHFAKRHRGVSSDKCLGRNTLRNTRLSSYDRAIADFEMPGQARLPPSMTYLPMLVLPEIPTCAAIAE